MALSFVFGFPGDGKSLYAMRLILAELLHGTRAIVTNCAIKAGDFNAYIQKFHPHASVDLLGRVRILNDEETRMFYLHRRESGFDKNIIAVTKEQEKNREFPDYSEVNDGCLYVLEEAHIHFGAREWMETGRSCLHYLSQHRKLGDDIICITQVIANVDKQFRSMAQDFTRIMNMGKRKWQFFKMPNIFVVRSFGSLPNSMTPAMETRTFTLDVEGLASCYDTAAGVGIHGRTADKMAPKKGISMWWIVILFFAVLVGFRYAAPAMTHLLDGKTPAKLVPVAVEQPGRINQELKVAQRPSVEPTARGLGAVEPVKKATPEKQIYLTGIVKNGKEVTCYLTTGEVVSNRTGRRLQGIGRDFAVIDGETIGFAPIVAPPKKTSDETYQEISYERQQRNLRDRVPTGRFENGAWLF